MPESWVDDGQGGATGNILAASQIMILTTHTRTPIPPGPRLLRVLLVLALFWTFAIPVEGKAQEKIREQLEQLVQLNTSLATTCSPSRGVDDLESICAGILVVLYGLEQGLLTMDECRTRLGDTTLGYLAPLWLPFARHYADFSKHRERLDLLGLEENDWGSDSKLDGYRFLVLLRLLHTTEAGRPGMDSRIHERYITITQRGHSLLQRLGASRDEDPKTQREACSRWILDRANPEWYAVLRAQLGTSSPAFVILRDEDVPHADASKVLSVAVRDIALCGPDRYQEKWLWHRVLLKEMFLRTREGTRDEIENNVNLYIPSYLLLCHAGTPISVFQPRPTRDKNTTAFTTGYEEDIPHQNLLSTASHLSEASALRYELRQAGLNTFNPIQHMIFFPYLAITDRDNTRLEKAVPIAGGYMGYIDAFKDDSIAHTVHLGLPERDTP